MRLYASGASWTVIDAWGLPRRAVRARASHLGLRRPGWCIGCGAPLAGRAVKLCASCRARAAGLAREVGIGPAAARFGIDAGTVRGLLGLRPRGRRKCHRCGSARASGAFCRKCGRLAAFLGLSLGITPAAAGLGVSPGTVANCIRRYT